MVFRTRQLACVFLLLSSLGAAQASTPAPGQFAFYGHYMSALLYRQSAAIRREHAPGTYIADDLSNATASSLPTSARATYTTTWTMRPPSAHSAFVHAVTGLAPSNSFPA